MSKPPQTDSRAPQRAAEAAAVSAAAARAAQSLSVPVPVPVALALAAHYRPALAGSAAAPTATRPTSNTALSPRRATAGVKPSAAPEANAAVTPSRATPKAEPTPGAPKGAPPKGGLAVSKAQQRWSFAAHMPWAEAAARRGPAFTALPERKK